MSHLLLSSDEGLLRFFDLYIGIYRRFEGW